MEKTAGIIIIGDEILTSKVQDNNSFFMAQELRSHGIQLCAYPIIPDSVNEIAKEVRTFSERFDFVPQNSIVVGVFEKNDVLPSGQKIFDTCISGGGARL